MSPAVRHLTEHVETCQKGHRQTDPPRPAHLVPVIPKHALLCRLQESMVAHATRATNRSATTPKAFSNPVLFLLFATCCPFDQLIDGTLLIGSVNRVSKKSQIPYSLMAHTIPTKAATPSQNTIRRRRFSNMHRYNHMHALSATPQTRLYQEFLTGR